MSLQHAITAIKAAGDTLSIGTIFAHVIVSSAALVSPLSTLLAFAYLVYRVVESRMFPKTWAWIRSWSV